MKASKAENIRDGLHVGNLKSQTPYFVDEINYQNVLKIYSEAHQYFSKIGGSYPSLGIGQLTAEILSKISKNDFSEIEKKVNEDIEKSLKGITNAVVLANMRKGADVPFRRFKMQAELDLLQVGLIRRKHPENPLDVSNFSIVNGELLFSDADKIKLKERYCKIYLNTPIKKEVAQITENILKQLNELKVILLRNNIKSVLGDGNLFSDCDTGITLNKSIMKFITK